MLNAMFEKSFHIQIQKIIDNRKNMYFPEFFVGISAVFDMII